MFSVRILTTDHYITSPVAGFDVTRSDFRNNVVTNVPVLRIFGVTSGAQKTCMHIHGIFPYLYVQYDGTEPLDKYLKLFANSIDKALNVAFGKASANTQHVYKIALVSGVPFYGYYEKEVSFLKIFLYNPGLVKKVADLLLGGAVLNKVYQPYEAHIPYNLQTFIDYNLYGMNMIHVRTAKFRQNSPEEVCCKNNDVFVGKGPNVKRWNRDTLPQDCWSDKDILKQSTCELEVDVVAVDIINRLEVGNNIGTNPGLVMLWEDEKTRRTKNFISMDLTPPSSPERERPPWNDAEEERQLRLKEILQELQPHMKDDLSSIDSSFSNFATPSSSIDLHPSEHLKSEKWSFSSDDTMLFDSTPEEEPIVNTQSILHVVASSQSFNEKPPEEYTHNLPKVHTDDTINSSQDLVELLVSMAEKEELDVRNSSSQKVQQILSQSLSQKILHLEDHDSILSQYQISDHEDLDNEVEDIDKEETDTCLSGSSKSMSPNESRITQRDELCHQDDNEEPLIHMTQLDGPMDHKTVDNKKRKTLGLRGPSILEKSFSLTKLPDNDFTSNTSASKNKPKDLKFQPKAKGSMSISRSKTISSFNSLDSEFIDLKGKTNKSRTCTSLKGTNTTGVINTMVSRNLFSKDTVQRLRINNHDSGIIPEKSDTKYISKSKKTSDDCYDDFVIKKYSNRKESVGPSAQDIKTMAKKRLQLKKVEKSRVSAVPKRFDNVFEAAFNMLNDSLSNKELPASLDATSSSSLTGNISPQSNNNLSGCSLSHSKYNTDVDIQQQDVQSNSKRFLKEKQINRNSNKRTPFEYVYFPCNIPVQYVNGIKKSRKRKKIGKSKVKLFKCDFQKHDLSGIGKEKLVLHFMTSKDFNELKEQVKKEAAHSKKEVMTKSTFALPDVATASNSSASDSEVSRDTQSYNNDSDQHNLIGLTNYMMECTDDTILKDYSTNHSCEKGSDKINSLKTAIDGTNACLEVVKKTGFDGPKACFEHVKKKSQERLVKKSQEFINLFGNGDQVLNTKKVKRIHCLNSKDARKSTIPNSNEPPSCIEQNISAIKKAKIASQCDVNQKSNTNKEHTFCHKVSDMEVKSGLEYFDMGGISNQKFNVQKREEKYEDIQNYKYCNKDIGITGSDKIVNQETTEPSVIKKKREEKYEDLQNDKYCNKDIGITGSDEIVNQETTEPSVKKRNDTKVKNIYKHKVKLSRNTGKKKFLGENRNGKYNSSVKKKHLEKYTKVKYLYAKYKKYAKTIKHKNVIAKFIGKFKQKVTVNNTKKCSQNGIIASGSVHGHCKSNENKEQSETPEFNNNKFRETADLVEKINTCQVMTDAENLTVVTDSALKPHPVFIPHAGGVDLDIHDEHSIKKHIITEVCCEDTTSTVSEGTKIVFYNEPGEYSDVMNNMAFLSPISDHGLISPPCATSPTTMLQDQEGSDLYHDSDHTLSYVEKPGTCSFKCSSSMYMLEKYANYSSRSCDENFNSSKIKSELKEMTNNSKVKWDFNRKHDKGNDKVVKNIVIEKPTAERPVYSSFSNFKNGKPDSSSLVKTNVQLLLRETTSLTHCPTSVVINESFNKSSTADENLLKLQDTDFEKEDSISENKSLNDMCKIYENKNGYISHGTKSNQENNSPSQSSMDKPRSERLHNHPKKGETVSCTRPQHQTRKTKTHTSNTNSTNKDVIISPTQMPPMRSNVLFQSINQGIIPEYSAFCSISNDIPPQSREVNGRISAIGGSWVAELPEYISSLPGFRQWQIKNFSSQSNDITQTSVTEIIQQLEKQPQTKVAMFGDREMIISPIKNPPAITDIFKSLSMDEKSDLYLSENINKNIRFSTDIIDKITQNTALLNKRKSDVKKNKSRKSSRLTVKQSYKYVFQCGKSSSSSTKSFGGKVTLEDSTISNTPKSMQQKHDPVFENKSVLFMTSTPAVKSSFQENVSNITPIIKLETTKRAPTERKIGIDEDYNVNKASNNTTLDKEDIFSIPSTSSTKSKRNKPAKKLFHETKEASKKIKNLFASPVPSLNPDISQIDGPTPKNTYNFKVDFPCLDEAKEIHEYQQITVLSLELHIHTRQDYCPDPHCDPIYAVFYSIFHDVPAEEGNRHVTGMICIDQAHFKVDDKFSAKNRHQLLLQKTGLPSLDATYVKTEMELIEQVVYLTKKYDPDIVIGYEIQMLSWGFLIQRANHLSIDVQRKLSRLQVKDRIPKKHNEEDTEFLSDVVIPGRIVLNLWQILKHELTLNVYTYENVVYHVLHRRVPLYSFSSLTFWYDHHSHHIRWKTVEYYISRAKGNLQILEQLDLIGQISEFARVYGIEFFHVLSRGSQYRVESMMLRIAKPMNFIPVSPSVQQRARMRAPECIPLTMEPESKFYTDPVVVVDFQSLYPSIMIAYNYCYSTCLGRLENFHKLNEGNLDFGCTSLLVPSNVLVKLKDDISICPNGVCFVKQNVRKGIISRMVEEILNTRLMVKKSMKEYKDNKKLQRLLHARQLSLKLIANVTFGYTSANFSGRMPCVEIGDSIVRKARETLEKAIKIVEQTPKWGAQVVYGDTDSMFILLKGRTKDEAFRIGQEIADAVTEANPKPVKLKFEKVYLPCVLQTKKRYVGFMYETIDQKDPVFDAKGIETVRRDSCALVSKMLEKSIKILFTTHDISLVKSYVQQQWTKLIEGKVGVQDCVFAKEYRGIAGYKAGACVPSLEIARRRLSRDRRSEPRVGQRVPYVVVYGAPDQPLIQLVRETSEIWSDGSLRINTTYYITKQIIPPLHRIFMLMGVDVRSWYNELPRIYRTAPEGFSGLDNKKGTIAQYFHSLNCPVCDEVTQMGICSPCKSDPQRIAVMLNSRIHKTEKDFFDLYKICTNCMGSQDTQTSCISSDCPIMFRAKKAARNMSLVATLTELQDKMLNL